MNVFVMKVYVIFKFVYKFFFKNCFIIFLFLFGGMFASKSSSDISTSSSAIIFCVINFLNECLNIIGVGFLFLFFCVFCMILLMLCVWFVSVFVVVAFGVVSFASCFRSDIDVVLCLCVLKYFVKCFL